MIEKIDPQLFTWSRWRKGSPADLLVMARKNSIIENKTRLKKYAVGYCDGESLLCRPKIDHKAIMFFKDGKHFWFHVTNEEFVALGVD